jgi:hypothetical protein
MRKQQRLRLRRWLHLKQKRHKWLLLLHPQ